MRWFLTFVVLFSCDVGLWKVTDVGFPAALKESSSSEPTSIGTERMHCYRAPELFGPASRYSQKSDVWALGCILYEMLNLKKAFKTDIEILEYSRSRRSFAISCSLSINEEAHISLSTVIQKTLQRRTCNRPTAALLIDAFESFLSSRHEESSTSPGPSEVQMIDDTCTAYTNQSCKTFKEVN